MKKFLLLSLVALLTTATFAQSEKYDKAMTESLQAVDTAFKNPASLLSLANKFERIASAEKSQWLPYYYAALFQINYVFISQNMKDGDIYATKADELIAKAKALNPNNSEITLLKSMSSTLRMLVDPMTRYMTEGTKSETFLQEAMVQDPTNPRPLYYKGTMLKNTPEQFGGGCKNALDYLLKAKALFETFKSDIKFYPSWGQSQNDQTIASCQ